MAPISSFASIILLISSSALLVSAFDDDLDDDVDGYPELPLDDMQSTELSAWSTRVYNTTLTTDAILEYDATAYALPPVPDRAPKGKINFRLLEVVYDDGKLPRNTKSIAYRSPRQVQDSADAMAKRVRIWSRGNVEFVDYDGKSAPKGYLKQTSRSARSTSSWKMAESVCESEGWTRNNGNMCAAVLRYGGSAAGGTRAKLNGGNGQTTSHETFHMLKFGHGFAPAKGTDYTSGWYAYGDRSTIMGRNFHAAGPNVPSLWRMNWLHRDEVVFIEPGKTYRLRREDQRKFNGNPIGLVWKNPLSGNYDFFSYAVAGGVFPKQSRSRVNLGSNRGIVHHGINSVKSNAWMFTFRLDAFGKDYQSPTGLFFRTIKATSTYVDLKIDYNATLNTQTPPKLELTTVSFKDGDDDTKAVWRIGVSFLPPDDLTVTPLLFQELKLDLPWKSNIRCSDGGNWANHGRVWNYKLNDSIKRRTYTECTVSAPSKGSVEDMPDEERAFDAVVRIGPFLRSNIPMRF